MTEKIKIHYVASTHWDREWYLPFQGFRYKLVKLIDKLLDILKTDPEYKFFVFDGQTVALEDYLEIRPEKGEEVEKFVQEGRILIGPWYTMPDERILSGEALIRNLLKGTEVAASFDVEAMKYGYICDIFGHIAQMPQIFKGLGIDYALLGRGTNEHTHPANMIWEAPDGSQVITYKLPDTPGYGMGREIYLAADGDNPGSDEWTQDVAEKAIALFEKEKDRTELPIQLWLDGLDHQLPGQNIPKALEVARGILPDAEIVFSHLPAFAEEVKPYQAKLPVFKGELIDVAKEKGGYLYLISHCLSSYYPMKQANDRCQNLLEKWAEPYFVWAMLDKINPAVGFLSLAWKYVLLNHPHDSICGCSVDQVHKDTEYRYDQAEMLAENVLKDIFVELTSSEADDENKELVISVFNPLPYQDKRIVTIDVPWPTDQGHFRLVGFSDDNVPCFDLIDEDGNKIAYQLQKYRGKDLPDNTSTLDNYKIKPNTTISFECEFTGISVRRFKLIEVEVPVRNLETMQVAPLAAENEFLRLSINPEGTINILDLETGNEFHNLLVFEDTGEIGDGWYHVKPVNNRTFLSTGSQTEISLSEDGPLVTSFVIEKTMHLPAEMDRENLCRSETRENLKIKTQVTLRKGARQVECRINVDNNIKDHRLRVLFPSKVEGDNYFVSQPFAFTERKRGIDISTHDWKECDTEERNFCGVVGVANDRSGLALVCGNGLHEISVRDDNESTLALTLFRNFKKTVMTEGETRCQLQQPMDFAFNIQPVSGDLNLSELEKSANLLASGVKTLCSKGLKLSKITPFLYFGKGLIHLSALKPAEDGNGVILRVYNPTADDVTDLVYFDRKIKNIVEVGLDEKPIEDQETIGDTDRLELTLPPFKVKTFRLIILESFKSSFHQPVFNRPKED